MKDIEYLDFMCIDLNKELEDEIMCKYSFCSNAKVSDGTIKKVKGMLSIDKSSGEVELIDKMPGDDENMVFFRARAKIRKHWNNGEYPSVTMFAAG
ncbi:hypothetical protein ACJJI3_19445 [Microbulbifer sp. ZKSA004]|uniref:hypothetical protein n=1 Tax=Microbulbifer sp. ZKSA004 TaxID=3243389 RepID=UPI004039BF5C